MLPLKLTLLPFSICILASAWLIVVMSLFSVLYVLFYKWLDRQNVLLWIVGRDM